MRFDPATHTVHAAGRTWRADPTFTVLDDRWFGNEDGWTGSPTYGHRTRRCRVRFESGWEASIVWGTGTYSTNREAWHRGDPFTEEPDCVEVGVCDRTGQLRQRRMTDGDLGWSDVESYVSDADLAALLDRLAALPTDADYGEAPPSHEEVMEMFRRYERDFGR